MVPSPMALTSSVSPVQHIPPSPPATGPASFSNVHPIPRSSAGLYRHAGYVDAHLEHLRKSCQIERLPIVVAPGEIGAVMPRYLDAADEATVRLQNVDPTGAGRV